MTERTLILVKPDGVERGLTGEILRRVEAKGYRIAELKQLNASTEQLAAHYAEHEGKPFYQRWWTSCSPGLWWQPCWRATVSSRASAPWPAPLTRRRRRPEPSAGIWAATGARRSRRTWSTAPTRWSPPSVRSASGSAEDADHLMGRAPVITGALLLSGTSPEAAQPARLGRVPSSKRIWTGFSLSRVRS